MPATATSAPVRLPSTPPSTAVNPHVRPRASGGPPRQFQSPRPPGGAAARPSRGVGEMRGTPADHEILFQKFFKSVGPRTYAAQVKRARNGNHFLVLTEGKRDEETADVRKTRLFVYGEDFVEFFRLVKSAAEFIRDNPVPDDVKRKRDKFWAKQASAPREGAPTAPRPAASVRPVQAKTPSPAAVASAVRSE